MQGHGVQLALCNGHCPQLRVDEVPAEQAWHRPSLLAHVALVVDVAGLAVQVLTRFTEVREDDVGRFAANLLDNLECLDGLGRKAAPLQPFQRTTSAGCGQLPPRLFWQGVALLRTFRHRVANAQSLLCIVHRLDQGAPAARHPQVQQIACRARCKVAPDPRLGTCSANRQAVSGLTIDAADLPLTPGTLAVGEQVGGYVGRVLGQQVLEFGCVQACTSAWLVNFLPSRKVWAL